MSLFGRLFGGGAGAKADSPAAAVEHDGFTIRPQPMADSGKFRVSALIEKDGRSHTLIRADTLDSREACEEASIRKAKQMIDEQGERLFGA